MRIGIYLGRHTSAASGMAVYSQSLVEGAVSLLATPAYRECEVVLYGDSSVLSEQLIDALSLSSVLTATSDSFDLGAGRYFRPLPNGARTRILFRKLPEYVGRKFGYILDQLLVPFLAWMDGIDILHCTMNYGLPLRGGAQVVTVHDLFQAFPVKEEKEVAAAQPSLGQRWYRTLFRLQFLRLAQVLVDAPETVKEITLRYRFDAARISVVPLGIDSVFEAAYDALCSKEEHTEMRMRAFMQQHALRPGFTLLFASLDSRKNLSRSIAAWQALPEELRKKGLVIIAGSGACKKQVKKLLDKTAIGTFKEGAEVMILSSLDRAVLPALLYAAGVLLVPTLAEGYGLPAYEAAALGTPCVSGELSCLSEVAEGLVHLCDVYEVQSITTALAAAHRAAPSYEDKTPPVTPAPRTMLDATTETFAVYQQVVMRHG